MAYFENFIDNALTLTDDTLKNFVSQAFGHLQGYIDGTLTSLAILYVIWIGYQALHQRVSLTLPVITQHIITLIVIITLSTSWDDYVQFVYDIFVKEPEFISQAISGDGQSAITGLSTVWKEGSGVAAKWFSMHGIKPIIYGCIGYACTFFVCLYALGLLIVSKAAMAVLLAIGPLFILLMLFNSTRELATGWLRALINFALIPIITTAVLLLTNELMKSGLPTSTEVSGDFFVYLGFSILSIILLWQVQPICAQLSSSIALESIGQSLSRFTRPLNKMGNKNKGNKQGSIRQMATKAVTAGARRVGSLVSNALSKRR